jgi:thymidylate synthase (FAD)
VVIQTQAEIDEDHRKAWERVNSQRSTYRTCVPAAEEMLGIEIKVLDHGFVIPIDYMGSDNDVVQAARTSFGPSGRPIQDDRSLIRYLLRHRHTTPFEMLEVKFLCRMPIFVARQWIRHRTANVNEMSLRYAEPLEFFYVPDPTKVSVQSKDNKQGRGEPLAGEAAEMVRDLFTDGQHEDMSRYRRLADEFGLAKELARAVLPVSLYTQWVWKIDLHNLMHFLGLRLDAHAQYEIRVFAEAMAQFVRAWAPLSWEAFTDYRLHAVTLSRQERATLRALLNELWQHADNKDEVEANVRREGERAGLRGRELDELVGKLVNEEV